MRILQALAKEKLVDVEQFDEGTTPTFTLSDSGFEYVANLPILGNLLNNGYDYQNSAISAPASDRVVPLNHNSSDYKKIGDAIDDLIETFRESNQAGESPEERERISRSLSAAKELWSGLELKVLQVKVGVIMAVEDAGIALDKVGKASAWALLIDLIKQYVKNTTGWIF